MLLTLLKKREKKFEKIRDKAKLATKTVKKNSSGPATKKGQLRVKNREVRL